MLAYFSIISLFLVMNYNFWWQTLNCTVRFEDSKKFNAIFFNSFIKYSCILLVCFLFALGVFIEDQNINKSFLGIPIYAYLLLISIAILNFIVFTYLSKVFRIKKESIVILIKRISSDCCEIHLRRYFLKCYMNGRLDVSTAKDLINLGKYFDYINAVKEDNDVKNINIHTLWFDDDKRYLKFRDGISKFCQDNSIKVNQTYKKLDFLSSMFGVFMSFFSNKKGFYHLFSARRCEFFSKGSIEMKGFHIELQ